MNQQYQRIYDRNGYVASERRLLDFGAGCQSLRQICDEYLNDSEESRVGKVRNATRRRTAVSRTVAAHIDKLEDMSFEELQCESIGLYVVCLSIVRGMLPRPSEVRQGIVNCTGFCTKAECNACEAISIALAASANKGRPPLADTAFATVFAFNSVCSAVTCTGRRLSMPIPYTSPAEKLLPNGAHR